LFAHHFDTPPPAACGLRLIGYDRPGYGGSTPQPGRTVADCAADVRAICAELGIDRLAMWGVSGGGPHLLAWAALLPDLVTAETKRICRGSTATTNIRRDLILHARRQLNRERRAWTVTRSSA
jgi:pimeloyl-ACP methyl ester carboxylesterase